MESSNARSLKFYLRHPLDVVTTIGMWTRAQPCELPVIFILGAPRSGTTLVQVILAAHSHCISLTEESGIFSPKPFSEYARFADIIEEPRFREVVGSSTSIVDFFVKFHQAILGDAIFQPGMRLVEKTPQHVRYIGFLERYFPKAQFLHVVRDPRDCYVSGKQAGNIYQAGDAHKYARYWKRCVGKRVSCDSPRIFDIRYEDLTTRPHDVIRDCMTFLGLELEEAQLDSATLSKDGRAKRKAFDRIGSNINSSTVGRWKGVLSPAEAKAFEDLQPIMKRFGYESAQR